VNQVLPMKSSGMKKIKTDDVISNDEKASYGRFFIFIATGFYANKIGQEQRKMFDTDYSSTQLPVHKPSLSANKDFS
jgi:hypothetical protein